MHDLISDLEMQIAKLMDLKDEKGGILSELRDHMIEIYSKIGVGLLKRHLNYED